MAKSERRPPTVRSTFTSPRTKVKPATQIQNLSEEQIRSRAYEIYLRRDGGPGDASSDWSQAERELRDELST